MIVSVPLKDFDFGNWLTQLKNDGADPNMAMFVYKDLRMFGAVNFRTEERQDDQKWDVFRNKVCVHLMTLNDNASVSKYCKDPTAFLGLENTNDKGAFAKDVMDNIHFREAMDGQSGIIDWLTRYLSRDLDLTWDDVFAAMTQDIPKVDAPQEQSPNADDLINRVEQLLKDTSLRSLEWPAIVGLSSKTGSAIVEHTQSSNLELQKRTGWKQGVLGLNGHVLLRIGADRSGSGGYCNEALDNDIHICSSPATPFSVVAHEWFHALDFRLNSGNGETLSESTQGSDNKKHIDTLVDNLNKHQSSGTQLETDTFIQSVRNNLEERWVSAGYPQGIGAVLEDIMTKSPKRPNAKQYKKEFETLKKFLADNNFARTHDLHATVLMTDLDVLRDSETLLKNKNSLWIEFAKRYEHNINNYLTKFKGYSDYFLSAPEQLAHSFEITSDGNTVAFPKSDQNLRYPTEMEQSFQKIHWKRFFKQITPWWEAQVNPAQVSFKDQLSKQRQTSDHIPELSAAAKI